MQKHIEKITNVTCRVASLSGLGRSPLASRHYRAGLSRNSASRLETNLQYSSSLVSWGKVNSHTSQRLTRR
jgi:hypothetical protein